LADTDQPAEYWAVQDTEGQHTEGQQSEGQQSEG
jgi:hypothetical protein